MKYKYDVIWRSKLPQIKGLEEEIIDSHINKKLSISELSRIYKCDRKPIQNILIKNGYSPKSLSVLKLENHSTEILSMYLDEQLTIQSIKKRIGCSYQAIKTLIQRNNIPLRNSKESKNTEDGRPKGTTKKLKNIEDLNDAISMYENGEVLEIIGKKYNITPSGLRTKFKKLGVKMRTLTESANLPSTISRKKATFLKNLGVENPMQHPIINEKSNINRYKFKSFIINGKKFSHLQGYEPQAIQYLVNEMKFDVYQIQSGRNVPKIRYMFEGANKMYFPDLYIKHANTLIEVKCEYTYNNMLELNKSKRSASIKSGYNHLTIIFNNSGTEILSVF